MKRQLLFVDDEPNVLSGLRRMLRGQRKVWEMHFACGGEEALELLNNQPIDVIVSDMRMPGIDGAELLTRVSQLYPHTIRLVLSGQSEQEKIFRAIGPAHQFLSKPCDPDLLIQTIERAVGLQGQLQNETLQKLTSKITSLPSLPKIYSDLVHELESDDVSMDKVGAMIENDLAMSAKVLQLVNSSFFGLPSHVTSPKHAVSLLGLNVIRPLTLSASVFVQYEGMDLKHFCLDREIQHGLSVALAARKIAQNETKDNNLVDDAFIAGMMHDIGKLILAVHQTESFENAIGQSELKNQPLWKSELEEFGTTHAAVGAHLLGLWGLSNPIVEAVAFHHEPRNASSVDFTPLTAVHAANSLLMNDPPYASRDNLRDLQSEFHHDVEYLQSIGLEDRLEQWASLATLEAVS